MRLLDLPALTPYQEAWDLQECLHAEVQTGAEEALILLEHPPTITLGRRVADAQKNLLAPPALLHQLGVQVVESDRGGDITYHGPGQLVAYPIIRLQDHALSVSAYVHGLEQIVIRTLADFGVHAFTDPTAVGVWVDSIPPNAHGTRSVNSSTPAKIAAIGVRIKRGVSLHGLALNLTTDLSHFSLINPCGLNRPVTSLHHLKGDSAPDMPALRSALTRHAQSAFATVARP
jgi:lipoate-protein ligase B